MLLQCLHVRLWLGPPVTSKLTHWFSKRSLEQEYWPTSLPFPRQTYCSSSSIPSTRRWAMRLHVSMLASGIERMGIWLQGCWMEQMFTAVIEAVVRVNATAPAMGLSTESLVSSTGSHPLQGVSVVQAGTVPAQDAIQMKTFWPS